jgi:hypothetical protein
MVHCSKFVVLFQKFSSFFLGHDLENWALLRIVRRRLGSDIGGTALPYSLDGFIRRC